jgi:DNA-binding transcriptional MocR family regulator
MASNHPLNPEAASPLYLQLQRSLRMLIQKSEWHPGMRLPAVPELASRFQVHRLTVLKALAGLKRTGWVQTVTGRGSFVADHLPEAPALRDPEHFPFEGSSLKVREHELGPWLGETLGRAQNRMLVSFSANFPPADLQTMKELGADAWAYGGPAGYDGYLDAIALWLANEGEIIPDGWGIRAVPGAQAGLALVLESMTIPGDRVLVESPCYVGALALIQTLGRTAVPVPVDRNGMNTERLASLLQKGDAKLLFTVPTFHNPTGLTFSRARRERILALTKTYGVPVVEDDTYGDLRFIGARVPACRSLPGAEHVIQLGSFSKSLAPGLRLGYIIAPNRVLDSLAPVQEVHTIAVPTLAQAVVGHFLADGGFKRHLSRLRKALRERRDAMLEAIHASFPKDSEITEPKGGMHLWVVLPEDLSSIDLQRTAITHGLSFAPGPLFFPDGRGTNCLRLNFSTHEPRVTREAIERLGGLIHASPVAST